MGNQQHIELASAHSVANGESDANAHLSVSSESLASDNTNTTPSTIQLNNQTDSPQGKVTKRSRSVSSSPTRKKKQSKTPASPKKNVTFKDPIEKIRYVPKEPLPTANNDANNNNSNTLDSINPMQHLDLEHSVTVASDQVTGEPNHNNDTNDGLTLSDIYHSDLDYLQDFDRPPTGVVAELLPSVGRARKPNVNYSALNPPKEVRQKIDDLDEEDKTEIPEDDDAYEPITFLPRLRSQAKKGVKGVTCNEVVNEELLVENT